MSHPIPSAVEALPECLRTHLTHVDPSQRLHIPSPNHLSAHMTAAPDLAGVRVCPRGHLCPPRFLFDLKGKAEDLKQWKDVMSKLPFVHEQTAVGDLKEKKHNHRIHPRRGKSYQSEEKGTGDLVSLTEFLSPTPNIEGLRNSSSSSSDEAGEEITGEALQNSLTSNFNSFVEDNKEQKNTNRRIRFTTENSDSRVGSTAGVAADSKKSDKEMMEEHLLKPSSAEDLEECLSASSSSEFSVCSCCDDGKHLSSASNLDEDIIIVVDSSSSDDDEEDSKLYEGERLSSENAFKPDDAQKQKNSSFIHADEMNNNNIFSIVNKDSRISSESFKTCKSNRTSRTSRTNKYSVSSDRLNGILLDPRASAFYRQILGISSLSNINNTINVNSNNNIHSGSLIGRSSGQSVSDFGNVDINSKDESAAIIHHQIPPARRFVRVKMNELQTSLNSRVVSILAEETNFKISKKNDENSRILESFAIYHAPKSTEEEKLENMLLPMNTSSASSPHLRVENSHKTCCIPRFDCVECKGCGDGIIVSLVNYGTVDRNLLLIRKGEELVSDSE